MTSRRVITAYYNVDGRYWCNANGDPATPPMRPQIGLYEQIALKLSLVHNYGAPAQQCPGSLYGFTLYWDGKTVAHSSDVNTPNGLPYWPKVTEVRQVPHVPTPEELEQIENPDTPDPVMPDYDEVTVTLDPGASAEYGRFIILLSAATAELRDALMCVKSRWTNMELTVSSQLGLVAVYREDIVAIRSNITDQLVTDILQGQMYTTNVMDIPAGSAMVEVASDTTATSLMIPTLIAPVNASYNYSVTNMEVTPDSFRVYFNATIAETGWKLTYTLLKKRE